MVKKLIIDEIKKHADEKLALHHSKFFQTHKGGYGEGDLFYGLNAPQMRGIVKLFYKNADFEDIKDLLKNPYHEVRMCALLIMAEKFKRASESEKAIFAGIYLEHVKYINNWDLVDLSAGYILGEYWLDKDLKDLWKLANSKHLWSERIAVISTFAFIRKSKFEPTLELCEFFLGHKHDLIHKATGWMLREAGKRDEGVLLSFLDKHHKTMPRTMLRYSIERLPQETRKHYMAK